MRFSRPACSQLMECPDDLAGKKAGCPKCGQKVLIPSPGAPLPNASNKTTLGRIEPTETAPGSPTAIQPGPAVVPTATIASPTTTRLTPAPPPWRKLRRFAWIAVPIIGGLAACLFCAALKAGITDYVWSLQEMDERADN